MRRTAVVLLALALSACASSKAKDDEPPSLVPPPDIAAASSPAVDAKFAELQTSMTELLERIDVLNARIAKLEAAAPAPPVAASAPPPATSPAPPSAPIPAPAPQPSSALHAAQIADSYRGALMLFGRGKLAESRAAFQQVFDADPSGELADNALFWIGETYFAARDYQSAMRYYTRVTKEYADQNKAPDALFKLGIAFEKTGDLAMARKAFQDVIARYPYSAPSASAKLELQRIKY
jgi:tol-pal system protein YbgF